MEKSHTVHGLPQGDPRRRAVLPHAEFQAEQRDGEFLQLVASTIVCYSAMLVWRACGAILGPNVREHGQEGPVTGFAGTIGGALDFLGLEWDEKMRDDRETALAPLSFGNRIDYLEPFRVGFTRLNAGILCSDKERKVTRVDTRQLFATRSPAQKTRFRRFAVA